jgi:hypothetical protein
MKKGIHGTRFLCPLILLSGMLLSVQLYARQTASGQQYPAPQAGQDQQPRQQPGQAPDQSGQQTTGPQAEPGVQVFTGTILKSGDKYVLQESTGGTTYDIDHQDEVKQFEGKKVRVHGTLDPGGKMIHVQ